MRYPAPLFLMVAVGLTCCSCHTPLNPASSRYADIAETVFRYIAQPAPTSDEDSHGLTLAHKVYFLQLDSHDPSPGFLDRLRDVKVTVRPLSLSVEREDCRRYDTKTGERGAAIYIYNIRVNGGHGARAEAIIAPGGVLRGSGSAYYLKQTGGKWTVVGATVRSVS